MGTERTDHFRVVLFWWVMKVLLAICVFFECGMSSFELDNNTKSLLWPITLF